MKAKWVWMALQTAIISVPVYWLLEDAEARRDPQLLIGVPALALLIAYTLTGALTALSDWVFRRGPRDVGEPQSKGLRPWRSRRRISNLP